MPLDGITLRSIKNELESIVGSKVNKISQPKSKDLVFQLYKKANIKLFLTANASNPRINITNKSYENPLVPPNFCMVLRKHLQGSSLLDVSQHKLDRVLKLDFSAYDEMGYKITKSLIIEIMGRHSNIILVEEDYTIIDAINRVNSSMSRVREILPGQKYRYLEDDKINILEESVLPSQIINRESNAQLYKIFYQNYTGMSPAIGKEIVFRAGLDPLMQVSDLENEDLGKLDKSFSLICKDVLDNNFKARIYYSQSNKKPVDFYPLELENLGLDYQIKDSMNESLDIFYEEVKESDAFNEKKNNIDKILKDKIEFFSRRISDMENQIKTAQDRDKYKVYADVLSANFHLLKGGEKSIVLKNFYDENMAEIEVPLDVRKNGPQNAQSFYKKYSKLKNREHIFKKELPGLKEELAYLQQVHSYLDHIENLDDLAEIEDELINQGYIKKKSKSKNKKKRKTENKESRPMEFFSSAGEKIYVGKNNKQNDHITLKVANKDDYFFHVQTSPGSHVIVKTDGEISDLTILEAAYLASHYSSLSKEDLVTVDYTQKKNVYKAKGAKPGMVYYNDFNSVTVDMRDKELEKILESKN